TGLGCQGVVRVFIERLAGRPDWATALRHNFAARMETHLSVVWECADPAWLGTRETKDAVRAPATAQIFSDRVPPPPRLLIFGAGDDAQPLTRMAKELGWRVEVFDPRPAFASAAR